ncbi:peptidase M23 [Streptomyces sp. A012304]|uniref:peptidase M23 n=1 Tax=Streptomyces sp. A012304 TaxID=375446 RepID=UPI00222F8F0B|nr:peptidase M23 [Streptomyces sp. A012304]GKQ35084.1 hypothetical protein ALMP_16300 [Streptomyces sp. A012304]
MNIRCSIKNLLVAGLVAGSLAAGPAAFAAPSAQAPAPTAAKTSAAELPPVYVWATGVNVRNGGDGYCSYQPSRANCPTVVAVVSQTTLSAYCQARGETIQDSGYSNSWWTYVRTGGGQLGWVNNIYLQGGEKMAGVPDCTY